MGVEVDDPEAGGASALPILVCASANPDKVAELQTLLAGICRLRPRPSDVPDVVEDADTLVGNARLKAAAIVAATGLPAVSDDTGLFVDALDGAPGVLTARFAGDGATYAQNRARLLAALDGLPPARRTARFVTVMLVSWPDGGEVAVEGVCPGWIATHERGERGFGYDSVFIPDPGTDAAADAAADAATDVATDVAADGPTFAELSEAGKHAISHRGRAVRALAAALARPEVVRVHRLPDDAT